MLNGLLVGSRISWRAQIDPVLLAHGIDVRWWWPSISHMGDMPRNCDVVIVMTDCCSHKLSKPAMAMARKASVPLICGNHRKAKMVPLLESRGFPCLVTHAETVAPGALDVTQLAIGTMCASILSELPELNPQEEISMPAALPATDSPVGYLNHAPGVSELKGTTLGHYRTVLLALAENPWLINTTVAERLKLEPGSVGVQCSLARETLGLLGRRGRMPARVLDRPRYEAACLALGVTPVTEDAAPPLAPLASYSSANGDRAQLASFSTMAKLAKAVSESKPAATPEPPTPPVATTGLLPGEPTKDTLEVLKLLLEAMRAEGVEFVSIDERGKVSIRRRVTISSNLSL